MTVVVATLGLLPAAAAAGPSAEGSQDASRTTRQTLSRPLSSVTVLSDGGAVAFGGRVAVARRAAGATAWKAAAAEFRIPKHCYAGEVTSSDRTVLIEVGCFRRSDAKTAGSMAWTRRTGWVSSQTATGSGRAGPGGSWTGGDGQVGTGRLSFRPGSGWTTLRKPPFAPRELDADRAGRLTAFGARQGSVVVSTLVPGQGWGPVKRFRDLGAGSAHLSVSPAGDRVVTANRSATRNLRVYRDPAGPRGWATTNLDNGIHLGDVAPTVDADGGVRVVWDQGVTFDGPGRIKSQYWAPGGRLSDVAAVSTPATAAKEAVVVAATPDGSTVAAVWNTQDRQVVMSVRGAAGGWGRPVVVDPSAPGFLDADVAVGRDGCVVALSGDLTLTRGDCAR